MHIFKTLALALGLTTSALSMAIDNGVEMNISPTSETTRPMQCLASYLVKPGDTCMQILERHPRTVTLEQLLLWNPIIRNDCRNLLPNQLLCIRAKTLSDCPSVTSTMPQSSPTMI